MTLEPGTYEVEWLSVDDRESQEAGSLTTQEPGPVKFESPFAGGPSVLHLKAG